MRSTELHGERRGLNLHLVGRVVRFRRIFLEVWIFRNVGNEFQNFVADHFSAAAAKREYVVPHQDHAGTRLVLMAYFIDPRMLNEFSRSQRAIALIKCFDVGVLQFHKWCLYLFLSFSPRERAAREQLAHSEMGCIQGRGKLVLRVMREEVLLFSFQATRAEDRQGKSLIKGFIAGRDERLTRYQI